MNKVNAVKGVINAAIRTTSTHQCQTYETLSHSLRSDTLSIFRMKAAKWLCAIPFLAPMLVGCGTPGPPQPPSGFVDRLI